MIENQGGNFLRLNFYKGRIFDNTNVRRNIYFAKTP
jgi:hypothetical protein